jgi:NAD(P) transhydrogenase subunit alpha
VIVSVPKETAPGERRVALVPELVSKLAAAGLEVHVQFGAGVEAGFEDKDFAAEGARLEPEVLRRRTSFESAPPAADEIAKLREAHSEWALEPYTSAAQFKLLSA